MVSDYIGRTQYSADRRFDHAAVEILNKRHPID